MKMDISKIGTVLIGILLIVLASTLATHESTENTVSDIENTVSGNMIISDIEEDFEDATLHIELRDVSLMDVAAVLISETSISDISGSAADSLSIPYKISHPELDERMTYSIFAFVDVDGDGEVSEKDYISTSHNDVAANSDNNDIVAELEFVTPYNDDQEELSPIEMDFTISKIERQEGVTQLLCNGEGMYDEIYLNIGIWTEIIDESENELSIDELEVGMKIRAYFGPAVTRSIPAISSAEKIVVIAE